MFTYFILNELKNWLKKRNSTDNWIIIVFVGKEMELRQKAEKWTRSVQNCEGDQMFCVGIYYLW